MKLHGNAALSWSGRQRLVERVVAEGWTLKAAAASAEVSVRCARKWVNRYRRAGEHGLFDHSLGAQACLEPHAGRADRGDRGAAQAAHDRGGDRRGARDGALDRLGDPDPARAGQARPPRARAGSALRTLESGRARPRRRQEARAHRRRRWLACPRRRDSALQPEGSPTRRAGCGTQWAGSTSTSRSTTTAASPMQRCSPTRRHNSIGFLAARLRSSSATASSSSVCSPTTAAPTARPSTLWPVERWNQAPAHPAIPAADQRQSRTLHPYAARRLGLRSDLPLSGERTAALDGWLWFYNHRRRHSAIGRHPPVTLNNLLGLQLGPG